MVFFLLGKVGGEGEAVHIHFSCMKNVFIEGNVLQSEEKGETSVSTSLFE